MSNLSEIERSIKPLEASWRHWDRVVIGEDKRIRSDDCALCAEYYDITSSLTDCTICPIRLHTEKDGCYGTVYHELVGHYRKVHGGNFNGVKCNECIRLAQEMRDLIKMLWDEALEKQEVMRSIERLDKIIDEKNSRLEKGMKGWTKHYKEPITPKANELWQDVDGDLLFFFKDFWGGLREVDNSGLQRPTTYSVLEHGKDGWKRVWPEVVRTKCEGDLCSPEKVYCCVAKKDATHLCTREEGHSGPHISCGIIAHNQAIWGPEETCDCMICKRDKVVRAKCEGDLCVTENECFNSFTDELDWLCTREKGHTGPHIACDVGYAHDLKTWED